MRSGDANALLRGFSWARLSVAVLLLALAPALPDELMPQANRGVLGLTLLAVVISSAGLLLWAPLTAPRRIAGLVCLLDAALVTGVVAATGGGRSIFAFLYVLSVTAACVLLTRTGAMAIAGVASLLYTGLVLGRAVVPLGAVLDAPEETTALEVLTIFLNSGTFLIVAIVASGLAARFRSARVELETQRQDLRNIEAFKDLVFQSVGTGLVAVDRTGTITAFNRAAEAITGVPAARAVGRPWSTLFGDTVSLAAVEAAIEANPRVSPRHEVSVARPGGGAAPVRMTFSPLRAGDGTRVGLISACDDLSVLRDMEARMREADRLATLGRMAANIAHEIRNPLASLTGAIEVLAGSVSTGEVRERLAHIVLKESGRLNGIIREFLEYARPVPLTRASVNVAESLDEILVLVEHRAAPGTLKIVREFAPVLVWDVDPQQFRQAIWNLCVNAVEAMAEGGELRVAAAVHADRLEVRVTDNGEGLAAADLGHVFEPFFSTKPAGSGLGLALVHRIVHDHGGEIDVRSTPGLGTTFRITLPARHA